MKSTRESVTNKLDLSLLPKSRSEAKAVGSKHYFTGKPCKNGHLAYRWTLYGSCSACSNMRHKKRYEEDSDFAGEVSRRAKLWDENNPVKKRERSRKYLRNKNYGIGELAVGILFLAQQGHCACCLKPFTDTPQVDHDHKTGKIRGLLCGLCNRALGLVKDDIQTLVTMIHYLEKHNAEC